MGSPSPLCMGNLVFIDQNRDRPGFAALGRHVCLCILPNPTLKLEEYVALS